MKRNEWISLVILLLVLLFSIYRYHTRIFSDRRVRIMMGTQVEISLSSKTKNLPAIIDSTFALIAYYETKFSNYTNEGALWEINNAETDSIAIDADFVEILTLAESFYHKTDKLYDLTITPLTELWNGNRISPPPPDSIMTAMSKVGFNRLHIGEDYLKKPIDMKINLGSIAKGYIIDKAAEYALKKGVVYGFINAGGDIRLLGDFPKNERIGIQHPRERNKVIAVLGLKEGAIVTSGDYERFFDYEGKRYHHIINPLTGYPVDNNTFSVTIIAPNATLADVLSTAVFLMDIDSAIEMVKSIPAVDCIIYYKDNDEIMSLRTQGIKNYIIREL